MKRLLVLALLLLASPAQAQLPGYPRPGSCGASFQDVGRLGTGWVELERPPSLLRGTFGGIRCVTCGIEVTLVAVAQDRPAGQAAADDVSAIYADARAQQRYLESFLNGVRKTRADCSIGEASIIAPRTIDRLKMVGLRHVEYCKGKEAPIAERTITYLAASSACFHQTVIAWAGGGEPEGLIWENIEKALGHIRWDFKNDPAKHETEEFIRRFRQSLEPPPAAIISPGNALPPAERRF
jgi:hypothetical protein